MDVEPGLWNHKSKFYYKGKEVNPFEGNPLLKSNIPKDPAMQNAFAKQMQNALKKTIEMQKNGNNVCMTKEDMSKTLQKMPGCEPPQIVRKSADKYSASIRCENHASCKGDVTRLNRKKYTSTIVCSGMGEEAPKGMFKYDKIIATSEHVSSVCPKEPKL